MKLFKLLNWTSLCKIGASAENVRKGNLNNSAKKLKNYFIFCNPFHGDFTYNKIF
jgi:hypothetical protein